MQCNGAHGDECNGSRCFGTVGPVIETTLRFAAWPTCQMAHQHLACNFVKTAFCCYLAGLQAMAEYLKRCCKLPEGIEALPVGY